VPLRVEAAEFGGTQRVDGAGRRVTRVGAEEPGDRRPLAHTTIVAQGAQISTFVHGLAVSWRLVVRFTW
jgi:hypothetical protein